jgi:hypothetical protein
MNWILVSFRGANANDRRLTIRPNAPYSTNTRQFQTHSVTLAKGLDDQRFHSRNVSVLLLLSELR